MRCTPRRSNDVVELVEAEGSVDRKLCVLLVEVERALVKLGFTLIYLFDGKEKVYRKGEVIVVLDYINCVVETTTSCEDLSNTVENLQRRIGGILSI